MRKDFGPKNYVYPQVVFIIATYNEDGSVDAMNAAWGGTADDKKVCICLASDHATTKNIIREKAFTISIGTKALVTECDYYGIVSANTVKDKFEKSKLHAIKSKFVNAPLIQEFPLTLECKLDRIIEPEGLVIGEIINVSIDESVLTDGKLDVKKLQPIVYSDADHKYNVIGETVADAFSIGLKLRQSFV